MDVGFGRYRENAAKVVGHLERLKGEGVELAVFPEASLTGYCVECLEDAQAIAVAGLAARAPEEFDRSIHLGEALREIDAACARLDMLAVVGFAEREGDAVYNSAALFEPGRPPRIYRKTHLPDLGLDKFVTPGDALDVFDTRLGRIGVLICFDLRPPEATRVLALRGAELLVLPTNWPEGAQVSADSIAVARAAENRIFVATCNRVGEENGFRFIGRSKIVHPTGRVLASADDGEAVLVADLDLAEARQKRTVTLPGRYETEVFASRRPELYGTIGNPGVP
jgi:predicted amidohydrolase